MPDGWISGLLRHFFWCALILGQQSRGVVGWDDGEGRGGEGREGWKGA